MASKFDFYEHEDIVKFLLHLKYHTVCKDYKPKKIYFAAPWFDDKSKSLYAYCQSIYEYLKSMGQLKASVFFPKDVQHEKPVDTFENDVKCVKECDVLVALVDKKDVGTAWEIGMAYALNKPIYLIGLDESTFSSKTNLMLAFTGKMITIDKWADFLTGNLIDSEDCLARENSWEGLE